MKIALVEPFFSGSHKTWATDLQRFSQHEVALFTMPGRHWKWRMHGGAIHLAEQYLQSNFKADLFLVSDMLDVTTFLSLIRHQHPNPPLALYFHENQLSYPWSPNDQDVSLKRDHHYAFINYSSALAADYLLFNSSFHQTIFLNDLYAFLQQYPDFRDTHRIEQLRNKSQTLPLALNLRSLSQQGQRRQDGPPLIVWNHRWEYDKGPDDFFQLLFRLKSDGHDFEVAILGEQYQQQPPIFEKAKKELANQIVHYGFAKNRAEYISWLWQSDISLVTCQQDFFGISVVEAIYCQCFPILPKRLAYPAHIPAEFQGYHLYRDLEEAYRMLVNAVDKIDRIRSSSGYQNFVAHYDWSILASQYDKCFSDLLGEKRPYANH